MSTVERPVDDIYYDMNPFAATYSCKCGRIRNHNGVQCDFCETICEYVGDLNARYHGENVTRAREHPFSINQKEYYDILWDGINNDSVCLKYLNESSFISNHLTEITNRLCTECDYVTAVELQPAKYKNTPVDEFTQKIFAYLDFMLNTERYGTGERMIDTVEQLNIDIFLSNLALIAANRLFYWIRTKSL